MLPLSASGAGGREWEMREYIRQVARSYFSLCARQSEQKRVSSHECAGIETGPVTVDWGSAGKLQDKQLPVPSVAAEAPGVVRSPRPGGRKG